MELDNIPGAYERFRKKMMSYAPITDGDFHHMAEMMHEKHCSKGEVLLKEGQVCNKYYFLCTSIGVTEGAVSCSLH